MLILGISSLLLGHNKLNFYNKAKEVITLITSADMCKRFNFIEELGLFFKFPYISSFPKLFISSNQCPSNIVKRQRTWEPNFQNRVV